MAEEKTAAGDGSPDARARVASKKSVHYPQGTVEMQAPFFKERGLDLSGFHRGTLNISVAPRRFRIRNARLHFSSVQWTSKHRPSISPFLRAG